MNSGSVFKYFFVRGCVIFLLLFSWASKCGESTRLDPLSDCEKRGFDIIFSQEKYKKAFVLDKFERDDQGHFKLTFNVKLSQLTRDNGFVAGHMWVGEVNPTVTEGLAGNASQVFFGEVLGSEGSLSFGLDLFSHDHKFDGVVELGGMHRGGVAAAKYTDFLPKDSIKPKEEWLGQAVQKNADTPFEKGAGNGEQGDEMGKKGWQELFIITSCQINMNRGFAFASLIDSMDNNELSFSYFKEPRPKAVTIRVDQTKNSSLIFVDSFVSAGYRDDTGVDSTGLFTVRHYTESIGGDSANVTIPFLDKKQNPLTTRGALACRSVIKLYPESKAIYLTDAEVNETVNSMLVASFGDQTGEKRLGLKCYLGLTALWPNNLAQAEKLKILHSKQFDSPAKSYPNKYDVSDKFMRILMVNTRNMSINNDILSSIFGNVLSGDSEGLSREEGGVLLKKLVKRKKDNEEDGEEINYLLGNIHIKFDH